MIETMTKDMSSTQTLSGCKPGVLVQFTNCRILFNGKILREELFYTEKVMADIKIDCNNLLIVPGYIDVQINGGFGYDFSSNTKDFMQALDVVAKGILQHGVTSFCPTLVTSPSPVYQQILPHLKKRAGGKNGAEVLGAHVEGPFINIDKKGAHDANHIKVDVTPDISVMKQMYGSFDNVAMITVAPELPGVLDCIPSLVENGVIVSIGHCTANLTVGEEAVCKGASFITHLFNAMLPFHHRDPGIVGVLTSMITPKQAFYGIISDGIHTHPTALRIAHRSHPKGIILVTDAIAALGLPPGVHKLGTMDVRITEREAKILGTDTLAGSICSMDKCIQHFKKGTGCSLVEAIEAATLHPAQLLGITDHKGTLNYGTDADFLLLDDQQNVQATFIAGGLVWVNNNNSPMVNLRTHYF